MSDDKAKVHSPAIPSVSGIKVEHTGYTLYVQIPDNYLECRCSYIPHGQGAMLTSHELADTLKKYGVLEMIDRYACEDFVVMAAAGRQQLNVLLACGIPPVAGTDGYFLLTAPSTTAAEDADDDGARVDMYQVQTFINVAVGDEIGRIIPPVPGRPGRNVKGMPVPSQPCKALKYTLGKNISLDETGAVLSATAVGRFCQSGAEFSVEEEFVVKGDVDFNVGIINFKGFVVVRGDVLDNFDITATKGLTVTGNIGVCSIISDGDITFCGMDGQDRGRIVCGGTLRAHHIHNTDIECNGDVIVDVEIHDCVIKTLGRVVVNKDTISGGSCIARGGIEAGKLGSPSARRTSLLVGVDYRYVEELKRLLMELTVIQTKIGEARSLEEATELRRGATALSARIATLREITVAAANAKINVKKTLHENVWMKLGDVIETVREGVVGPLTIVENISEGVLRFIPMSSMDVKATDIEQAFILEQKQSSKE
jgi:uncharacterized protein (DUF342 family)